MNWILQRSYYLKWSSLIGVWYFKQFLLKMLVFRPQMEHVETYCTSPHEGTFLVHFSPVSHGEQANFFPWIYKKKKFQTKLFVLRGQNDSIFFLECSRVQFLKQIFFFINNMMRKCLWYCFLRDSWCGLIFLNLKALVQGRTLKLAFCVSLQCPL